MISLLHMANMRTRMASSVMLTPHLRMRFTHLEKILSMSALDVCLSTILLTASANIEIVCARGYEPSTKAKFCVNVPQGVARNYIFSLIWRCYGPKRDILDYWKTILYWLLSY